MTFDPGGTTGWVRSFPAATTPVVTGQTKLTPYELFKVIEREQPNKIIYETFKIRQNRLGVDLTPVELIGVILLCGDMFDIELIGQGADVGLPFWTNDKLRHIGLYVPGQQHGMDALRHYLTRLVVEGDKSWVYKLKGMSSV